MQYRKSELSLVRGAMNMWRGEAIFTPRITEDDKRMLESEGIMVIPTAELDPATFSKINRDGYVIAWTEEDLNEIFPHGC